MISGLFLSFVTLEETNTAYGSTSFVSLNVYVRCCTRGSSGAGARGGPPGGATLGAAAGGGPGCGAGTCADAISEALSRAAISPALTEIVPIVVVLGL